MVELLHWSILRRQHPLSRERPLKNIALKRVVEQRLLGQVQDVLSHIRILQVASLFGCRQFSWVLDQQSQWRKGIVDRALRPTRKIRRSLHGEHGTRERMNGQVHRLPHQLLDCLEIQTAATFRKDAVPFGWLTHQLLRQIDHLGKRRSGTNQMTI